MKRRLIIAVLVLLAGVSIIAATIYVYGLVSRSAGEPPLESRPIVNQECLGEDKEISYKAEDKGTVLADLTISVNDESTGNELISFKIDNVYRTIPRMELHRCGVYTIRFFNYDPQKTKQNPGFKVEIWKYRYNGKGDSFFLLSEKKGSGLTEGDYSYAFRISPNENYLVLERAYLGKEDYALVIKDSNTKQDVFVLSIKSIAEQYPDSVGNFNMREWTQDSRYFWGNIFDGAYVLAYFRIDVNNWKADIFEAPDGSMGGMPLNVNTGYVPIQPGLVWTGDVELTQELKEKDRKEGKKSFLYLYNLFAKESILIESTDEPQFFFKPKWLSDTELEYILPSGEKRIYQLAE